MKHPWQTPNSLHVMTYSSVLKMLYFMLVLLCPNDIWAFSTHLQSDGSFPSLCLGLHCYESLAKTHFDKVLTKKTDMTRYEYMNNLIKLKCQNLSFITAGFLLQDRGQAFFSALPQKCMICSSIKQKWTLLSISYAYILTVTDPLHASREPVLK